MSFHTRATALATLVAAACASPVTQIIVTVDTDLCIPGEIDRIEIVSTRGDHVDVASRTFADPGPGLPLSRSIVAGAGGTGPLAVTVTASLDGVFVVERRAVAEFVAGEQRVLRVDLSRRCVAVEACLVGQTCVEGRCQSIEEASVRAFRPEEFVERDASVCPPAVDGGAIDASTGGDGGECICPSDDVSCTREECDVDGTCLHTPDDLRCTELPDGRCDPLADCAYCPLGDACDDADGDPCTTGVCTDGVCEPVQRSCRAEGSPICQTWCNPATGACEANPAGDADLRCVPWGECIVQTTCVDGACVPTASGVASCETPDLCTTSTCDVGSGACGLVTPEPFGTECFGTCCGETIASTCDGASVCQKVLCMGCP